jgi:hypothetical protein
MGGDPGKVRRWVARAAKWAVGGVVAVVVLPIAGQFSINTAQQNGVFDHPWALPMAVIGFLLSVISTKTFGWVGGLIVGFGAGTWLDSVLRRKEYGQVATKPPSSPVKPAAKPMTLREQLGDWIRTDRFTVHEAACLWAGYLPGYFSDQAIKSKIAAASRLIATDLRNALDTSENALSMIGNHDGSYIDRDSLRWLAEKHGVKPSFLFIDG